MSDDAPRWYFAYGSNMGRATFIERRGMRPLAARRAYLDDHRLCFDLPIGAGERGVANLVVEPGARTWGVVYRLSAEACAFLDRTEGVDRGFYRRIAVELVADADAGGAHGADRDGGTAAAPRDDGARAEGGRRIEVIERVERLSAFAYLGDARDPRRKPSARYLGLLVAGAREGALPPSYVAWLEAFPLAIDEREAAVERDRRSITTP